MGVIENRVKLFLKTTAHIDWRNWGQLYGLVKKKEEKKTTWHVSRNIIYLYKTLSNLSVYLMIFSCSENGNTVASRRRRDSKTIISWCSRSRLVQRRYTLTVNAVYTYKTTSRPVVYTARRLKPIVYYIIITVQKRFVFSFAK